MQLLANPQSFATHLQLKHNANSSSSHSVVLVGGWVKDVDNKELEADEKSQCFGWQYFVLRTREEKMSYVLQTAQYSRSYGEDYLVKLYEERFQGVTFNDSGYIDHQSVGTLQIPVLVPLDMETDTQKIVFDVWRKYVIDNPNLVIVGGNDNDDVSKSEFVHSSRVSEISDEIAAMYSCYDCVVTQDENTTTLFSPEKGKRVIIDWTKHGFPKLRMPALVDLKITDYCTFNCAFCYQGSTKQGKHVDINELKQIIDVLSDSGVVELVVGGGEPTQHPDFKEFLQYAKQKNLSVSFTTKAETWINSKQNYWLDYTTGAVAFSVEKLEDVRRIHGKFLSCDKHRDLERVQFQCIEGVVHSYNFEQILKYCFVSGLSLTMLGFKETGRGIDYKRFKNDEGGFVYRVRDLFSTIDTNGDVQSILPNRYDSNFALLCDTKFAQKNKTLIASTLKNVKNYEVRKQFIFEEEGLVSCYIDPPNQVVMKSSYHQDCAFKYDAFTKETFEQAWLQVRTPIT